MKCLIRFLPHNLLGLVAMISLPVAVHCAGQRGSVIGTEPAEEVEEAAAPSPGAVKFWEAIKLFESKRPEDIASGRAALEAAADLEFSHAQFELGRHLLTGSLGFKKSARKGASQFLLAAERGNAFAMVAAGQCYHSGTGVSKNLENAEKWLRAAVARDADFSLPVRPPGYEESEADAQVPGIAGMMVIDPAATARNNAHFALGMILQGRKEFAEAHKHFVAGGEHARDGNLGAARQAALDYAFGIGTDRNLAKAREMLGVNRALATRIGVSLIQGWVQSKWVDDFAAADIEEEFSQASDEAANEMMLEIAERFSNRKSKDYNAHEAAEWYAIAADSGQHWAMIRLALMHGGGELGAADPAEAFKWWERAGGDTPAKNVYAAANLAICLENGIGVERDPERAAAIFTRYKAENYLCHLGSKGAAPKGVVTLDQARKMLGAAAKKGDPHAQYLLGKSLYDGEDEKVDPERAISWFRKAAKVNHPGALRQMGIWSDLVAHYDYTQHEVAMDYLRKASDLGDAQAAASLAYLHQSGRGTPVRLDVAEHYYLRAIELDPTSAQAQNNLGAIYEDRMYQFHMRGGGDAAAMEAAVIKCFEEASKLGFPIATMNLGNLYLNGKIVPKDVDKAYAYFDQAAAEGVAEAHYRLGLMHETGIGVPVTLSEAAYHYRLAALGGHKLALNKLINSYFSGRGVDVDLDRAKFWLFRAIAMGDTNSIIPLGDVLLRQGEPKLAVTIFRSLAEHHDNYVAGFACERLSRCYEGGIGVKASASRSARYFKLAIEKRNGDALTRLATTQIADNKITEGVATMTLAAELSATGSYSLGQMYFFGTHVPKDEERSLKLMRRAADDNHPKAMYFLAAATFNRVPTAPEIDEALRLVESAEKLGVPEAARLREQLERRRDHLQEEPEQIARPRSG